MDFIFTIITAAIIATSTGVTSTATNDAAVGPPVPAATEEQGDPVPCYAPPAYDVSADTYYCPY